VKNGLQVDGQPGGRVHIATVSGLADASPGWQLFSQKNRRCPDALPVDYADFK
jgi:hypothetical protein